ncbi:hypothetical protein [Marininema halotolerans]|uniref:Uncharacterized protein n=1 Tax=Marininema halotolerans TaxID=1155944 RepID=A0A1I6U282_9BACL|nr:hypothetical protein [Marininema halotolerans]SFS95494.1 hypothetical protein SAMN05444972_1131 [Marininema halotolerans]
MNMRAICEIEKEYFTMDVYVPLDIHWGIRRYGRPVSYWRVRSHNKNSLVEFGFDAENGDLRSLTIPMLDEVTECDSMSITNEVKEGIDVIVCDRMDVKDALMDGNLVWRGLLTFDASSDYAIDEVADLTIYLSLIKRRD